MSLDPLAPDAGGPPRPGGPTQPSATPRPTAPSVPGYELGDLIGQGGVATVWAATKVVDRSTVAVKVVPVVEPGQAHALARELAVLGRVEVDGLVGFHEAVGLDCDPPAVALVLDHLGGGSLERAVRARGHLSVGESVTVLAPVARAVAGLHAVGVVHGDVTPANVLLELSGRPFLADLGVARLAGEVPGSLYGTEGFVAPEVLDDGALSAAADVYAVGALAWWCVTGQVPGPGAVRRPLAEVAPGLPTAWSEVTTQALLGDPALRPTAAELALAYYDSAPCEPLRLVVGKDETSLLTQRLRRPAQTPVEPSQPGRREALAAHLRGRAGALATVVALVVFLGVGALGAAGVVDAPEWLGREASGPGAARAGATTSSDRPPPLVTTTAGTTRPVSGTAASTTASAPDPATDPTAPRRDPWELMVALSSLRAEAMNSRSARLVADLDAPGSGALAQDTALLADLAASGTTWQGVGFEVTSARTVTQRDASATIEAVVGTAAYRVVGATGEGVVRAAVPGQAMRFELRWSDGRWRVDRVSGTDG